MPANPTAPLPESIEHPLRLAEDAAVPSLQEGEAEDLAIFREAMIDARAAIRSALEEARTDGYNTGHEAGVLDSEG